MTELVNSNGQRITYLVVKPDTKTVLAALRGIGETTRRVKELMATHGDNLAVHNVTHSHCPEWVQDFVRSDAAYCNSMASDISNDAEKLRLQAAELMAKADDCERNAGMWNDLAAGASIGNHALSEAAYAEPHCGQP